eukprot:6253301-Prymnesium_polylepis.1
MWVHDFTVAFEKTQRTTADPIFFRSARTTPQSTMLNAQWSMGHVVSGNIPLYRPARHAVRKMTSVPTGSMQHSKVGLITLPRDTTDVSTEQRARAVNIYIAAAHSSR